MGIKDNSVFFRTDFAIFVSMIMVSLFRETHTDQV